MMIDFYSEDRIWICFSSKPILSFVIKHLLTHNLSKRTVGLHELLVHIKFMMLQFFSELKYIKILFIFSPK